MSAEVTVYTDPNTNKEMITLPEGIYNAITEVGANLRTDLQANSSYYQVHIEASEEFEDLFDDCTIARATLLAWMDWIDKQNREEGEVISGKTAEEIISILERLQNMEQELTAAALTEEIISILERLQNMELELTAAGAVTEQRLSYEASSGGS